MTKDEKSYGEATVGFGTPQEHKIKVVDFLKSEYIDNRLISVCMLEDESYIFSVENPTSSGRAPHQSIRLGKESAIGFISTLLLYFNIKYGEDGVQKLLEEAVKKGEIDYALSDNLKPLSDL